MAEMDARKEVMERVIAKLREKCEDQAGFGRVLALFRNAARMQKPLQSLNGYVLDPATLSECLQAVRQSCNFPIPPDPETKETDPSPFQQGIEKIREKTAAPAVDRFTMLYLRVEPDTLSVIKAGCDKPSLTFNFLT